MAEHNEVVDDLNQLLRDELSAIETYRMAIDKNLKAHGQDSQFEKLTQIMRDHEQAAARLVGLIQSMGGIAANDSGTWGTWTHTVMGAARLLGDKTALRALREGEESGIRDYRTQLREVLPDEVLDVYAKNLIAEEEHVRQLDRLIAAA